MSASIIARPTGAHLFVASALTAALSSALMGVLIMLLLWVSEGAPDLLTGLSAVFLGALLGLLGGSTGSPVAVLTGALLFLFFGRILAAQESSTGVYRRVHWLSAGALVGALVVTVMLVEQPLELLIVAQQGSPLLYGLGVVTGMVGMLFWHAVVGALTRGNRSRTD